MDFSESVFRGLRYGFESRKSGSPAEVANQVEEVLKGKGYRVLKREEEGKRFLAADKGRIGRGAFCHPFGLYCDNSGYDLYFSGDWRFSNTYGEISEGDKVSPTVVPKVRIADPRDNVEIKLNKFRAVYSYVTFAAYFIATLLYFNLCGFPQ
ncbi:MAG: cytochrome c biosis protein [Eubacteriales bacterium]|nr:cytochrome c biosis protein [Eubacteriales bacterium]